MAYIARGKDMSAFVSFIDLNDNKLFIRISAVQAVIVGVGKNAPFTNLVLGSEIISVREKPEQVMYKLQNN